ncbi:MAG: nitrile hydratase subunit beta [Rhodospirillales bacterium]
MTETKTPHRGYHDLGGLDGGAINQSEHVLAPWEKRVDSIRTLLGDQKRRIMRADVLRHAIETMGQKEYDSYTYYEKWITAVRKIVTDRNIVTADEIDRRKAEIRQRLGLEKS